MKYVSIDIETTGLDENQHQILEFAAIIEDTQLNLSYEDIPKFRRVIINPDDKYVFSSYACSLNTRLVKIISRIVENNSFDKINLPNMDDGYCYPDNLIVSFADFLTSNDDKWARSFQKEIIPVGKNFKGFDQKFITRLKHFNEFIKFEYRTLDPASLFVNWDEDASVPSTSTCKKRAGLGNSVSHEALADAWDVIQLFRFDREQKNEFKRLKKLNEPNFDVYNGKTLLG